MRLPRVRLTVSKLLFAIAVIAANCGVLRLGYEMFENALVDDGPSLSILPFSLVGSLPLVNVALTGTMLFAARSFRPFRGESGPPPAGVTYFSLHFLAILAVVTILMPGAIDRYLEALSPLMEYAAKGWSTVFSRFEDVFPPVVVGCVFFGVCISGPALLLSWIGGLLARRVRRDSASGPVPDDDLSGLAQLPVRGHGDRRDAATLRR